MFENLSERLEKSFKILKGQGKITEINVAETLKEVRRSLLDADVNYKIAKEFTNTVKEKALGMNVLTAVKPGQMMVKIVHDELIQLMGGTHVDINIKGNPAVILMSGLQGSGKTTFIRKYAQYLMEQGMNIGILENDYGAVNVDMMLLQDLMGDNCELEMISGGCDKETHRRRFRTKLIAMGMCGYDRVLIEPSGIFDMDEFFDALHESPLDRWYEIGNVITVVDAVLEENLSEDAEFILASEVANAGIVLLSKAQEAAETDIERTKAHLNKAMESVHCDRQFGKEIFAKDWNKLSDADFKKIQSAGYVGADYEKKDIAEEDAFQSLYFMNLTMPVEKLEEKVKQIFNDKECGNIFRIKGFMQTKSDQWIELNATHQNITIQPIKEGQEIFIVIGEKLNKEKINTNLLGTQTPL